MSLLRVLAFFTLLPACDALRDSDAHLSQNQWLRVRSGWYCEGGRCGRTASRDDHDYYVRFAPDGSVQLAYPDIPFGRAGSDPQEKIRCRFGHYSLDGHRLTMTLDANDADRFEAETLVREVWNIAGGSITVTPIPGQELADGLDRESWEPMNVLPDPTSAEPCPRSFARSSAR